MFHLHMQSYLLYSWLKALLSILNLLNWLSEGPKLNFPNARFPSLIPLT